MRLLLQESIFLTRIKRTGSNATDCMERKKNSLSAKRVATLLHAIRVTRLLFRSIPAVSIFRAASDWTQAWVMSGDQCRCDGRAHEIDAASRDLARVGNRPSLLPGGSAKWMAYRNTTPIPWNCPYAVACTGHIVFPPHVETGVDQKEIATTDGHGYVQSGIGHRTNVESFEDTSDVPVPQCICVHPWFQSVRAAAA